MENKMNKEEYSQYLEDQIWSFYGDDSDLDCDELLDYLNSGEFIRPFSDRLLHFYNEHCSSSFSGEEAAKDLLKKAAEANIKINRNTVLGWFSGKSEPKKGENDRDRLYSVAFAMGLNEEETSRLFHKVFFDKAFNKRNVREFVFLNCLHFGKSYSDAQRILSEVKFSEDNRNDSTVLSKLIGDYVTEEAEDEAILSYIFEHPHNFALNDTYAKKCIEELLLEITGDDEKTGIAYEEYCRFISYEGSMDGKSKGSIDFMLYVITGIDFVKDKSRFKEMAQKLPREIVNQFPDKRSFSDKTASAYVLRKELILLYFYSYWTKNLLSYDKQGDYDAFRDELNTILFDCGYSELYVGNPYDWLFLYCSATGESEQGSPVDVLRDILASIE